jgi:tetratricopeptide (TPR) repeat protein
VYYANRIFAIAALLVIAIAGIFSIRLGIADQAFRRQTPEGVARALRILPDNANYLMMRALQLDYDGADTTSLFERAAHVNPLSSAPRIRLGLAAETRGDLAAAEKWLLDAARVDRQFEPRWTLANFYFRSGRRNEFWKWMRAALEVSYGDRRLAYELCWRMTQDPDEIATRGIPAQHDVLATYIIYVMGEHHEAVGKAAMSLAALHNHEDVSLLEGACDQLIADGKVVEARELWARLGRQGAGLITDGEFQTEPSGHGFDWRPAHSQGITHLQVSGASRVLLSGTQPESCELLRRYVALEPGKWYSLRWEARTRDFSSPTGIKWSAGTAMGALEKAEDWRDGAVEFKAMTNLMPLVLEYHRPTGRARAEGWIELRKVSLVEKR